MPELAMGPDMADTIIERCEAKGLRLTEQRRTIAHVLESSDDHPDVEQLYGRASAADPRISLATVYRTVKLFEEAGIIEKLEFGDGRARYEDAERDHHDHLIDLHSGAVIEFVDEEIEALQEKIARKLGYDLKGHRLELYGVPKKKP
jgi:Fur family transcriptional regulator, ferric uptake regulator